MVTLDPSGSGSTPPGQRLLRIPHQWRAIVRADETGLVFLGAIVGMMSGCFVALMIAIVQTLHHWLFAIDGHEVSGAAYIDPIRAALVPATGFSRSRVLIVATKSLGNYAASRCRPQRSSSIHGGYAPPSRRS